MTRQPVVVPARSDDRPRIGQTAGLDLDDEEG